MHRTLLFLLATALTGCTSSFDLPTLTGTDGREWDVVAIGNTSLTPGADTPYLGFNDSTTWGFTGCNHLSGGRLNADGRLDFSGMACTMMACPDSRYESAFLAALSRAHAITTTRRTATIKGADGTTLLTLRRSDSSAAALNGRWNVVALNGRDIADRIPDDGETPYLLFDLSRNRLSGFGGCNRLMATLDRRLLEKGRLEMPHLGATRMLCRDMAIEQELLEALAAVRSYEVQHHRLRLYDADGTARVVLLAAEE